MAPQLSNRKRRRFNTGPADLQPGQQRILDVNGEYFALHNRLDNI